MKDKSSFILYSDYIVTVNKLSDEQAGKLFKLILDYVNDKNPITDDFILNLVFDPIKLQLKRDLADWVAKKEKRSEAGRIGGERSAEVKAIGKQTQATVETVKQNQAIVEIVEQEKPCQANQAVTDNVIGIVNDTVNVTVNDTDNETVIYDHAYHSDYFHKKWNSYEFKKSLSGVNFNVQKFFLNESKKPNGTRWTIDFIDKVLLRASQSDWFHLNCTATGTLENPDAVLEGRYDNREKPEERKKARF